MLSGALAAALMAAVPTASYRVAATVGTWQPLDVSDVAKTIEQSALEVLSKPGLLALERADPRAGPPRTDYTIEIRGRLLDEAETHTVYVAFSPGARADLPSFRASDTVALSKLDRRVMMTRIEASARKAARDLLEALRPALQTQNGAARPGPAAVEVAERPLPWQWPEVVVPRGSWKGGKHDLDAKRPEAARAALRVLLSAAITDGAARRELERCALGHRDAKMRLGCLRGLSRASRDNPATQRVVIQAFRKDPEDDVREEAGEQMLFFTGAARDEAIQAWLEAASACRGNGPLAKLGDLPNLDAAIRSCLVACGKKPKYQRSKSSCIELLGPLSGARRRAVLWPFLEATDPESPLFLEGAGEREGSIGTDWQRAAEALLERSTRWDPAFEDILWRRYQRSLSSFALDALAEWGTPSERLAKRLLEALETAGDRTVIHGLRRMSKADPALAAVVKEKAAELLVTGAYPKTVSKSDLEGLAR